MHKLCFLFSLVRLLLKWKTLLNIAWTQGNIVWKTVCGGNQWQSSDLENRITVGCFVPWCNVSHCLIWHSAATLGFVTFYGPSAPVPPIVPEFSIFGKKLDSLNWCIGQCFLYFERDALYILKHFQFFFFLCCCSVVQKTILENMIQLGRSMKHFSLGHLNVMLSFACYWHVALPGVQIIFLLKHKRNKKRAKLIDISG